MKEIGIKYLTKKGYIIYYTIYYICSQFTYLYILPNFSTFTYSNCIQSLDAGAVEQVCIKFCLSHVAPVFDKERIYNILYNILYMQLYLDAGAVEQMRIELCLRHVAPVFLDELLNPVLPPHMRWLVGVCLEPFPPAGVDIVFQKRDSSMGDHLPAHIKSCLPNQWPKRPSAHHHTINKRCGQVHLAHVACQLDSDQPTGKRLEEDHQADRVDPGHQGGKGDQISILKALQPNENNLLLLSSP